MNDNPQISDRIWHIEPPNYNLFGRFMVFTSAEAMDWYIRGCPCAESIWEHGLMGRVPRPRFEMDIDYVHTESDGTKCPITADPVIEI